MLRCGWGPVERSATVRCPDCGAENDPEETICSACGAVLDEAPQACPRCGTENPPEAGFCSSCGFAIGGTTETAVPSAPDQPPVAGPPTPMWQLADGIRPRGAWELVSDSYRVIWHNFWAFFRLALLLVTISISMGFIPFLGGVIASAIAAAAEVIAAMLAVSGERVAAFRSVRAAFRKFIPALGVIVLRGLALVALVITVIGIPVVIYLGVRWIFLVQVVMAEETGVFEAFNRSSALVRGQWWQVFGRILLMALASALILVGLVIVVALLSTVSRFIPFLEWPVVIGAIIIAVPFISVWEVFATLLYIDFRARKEGYSYAQVAQALTAYD